MAVDIGTTTGGATAWLADAAAASYAAMLAAGMPAGGITSAGRSYAEQAALYAEKGPSLAAKPGTSNHEKGLALDISTSSSAQAWLLDHGAENGWTRPLDYEPWHWEYGGDGGVVGTVRDAASNIVDGAKEFVSDPLGLSAIATDVRTLVLQAAFVLAGLGLVVLGVNRLVVPQITKAMGDLL